MIKQRLGDKQRDFTRLLDELSARGEQKASLLRQIGELEAHLKDTGSCMKAADAASAAPVQKN